MRKRRNVFWGEMMNEADRYTLEIKWSDADSIYVVLAPEWAHDWTMPIAEGKTYEEAAARGHNALEHMVEITREDGKSLPAPGTFEIAHL